MNKYGKKDLKKIFDTLNENEAEMVFVLKNLKSMIDKP